MVKISRRSDGGKSTKMSFQNVRYGSQKTVSKHLKISYHKHSHLMVRKNEEVNQCFVKYPAVLTEYVILIIL